MDGIIDSMGKLQELVMDREAWGAACVKKPKRRRTGTREQTDIKCARGHVIHHDEATVSSA